MAIIAIMLDLVLSLRRIFSIEPILFPTIISPPVRARLATEQGSSPSPHQELSGASMVVRILVVNRTTIVSVALIVLSAVGGATYEVHRRLESLASNLDVL